MPGSSHWRRTRCRDRNARRCCAGCRAACCGVTRGAASRLQRACQPAACRSFGQCGVRCACQNASNAAQVRGRPVAVDIAVGKAMFAAEQHPPAVRASGAWTWSPRALELRRAIDRVAVRQHELQSPCSAMPEAADRTQSRETDACGRSTCRLGVTGCERDCRESSVAVRYRLDR